jgi:GR25 family glycosyltransferase involved in LPS biosynthesis
MDLFKHTLYINLDHREDRNIHTKIQLSKIGIQNATRISATKTANGAIGCSLSHIKCMEMAKENDWSNVFICEDDIKFTNPELFLENIQKFNSFCQNTNFQWDLLMVGGNNFPPYNIVPGSNDCIVQVLNCRTTIGYIVQKHYYDVLIQNFREGVLQLIKNPTNKNNYAVDMYWAKLQQKDKWFLIVPLTVTQTESYSDVENEVVNYDHVMLKLDKEWLFEQQYQQQMLANMTCFHRPINYP